MNGKINKNIVFGNVELDDGELDLKYAKIRVTTFVDLDVVQALKKKAKNDRTKYQTLLNQILRDFVFGDQSKKTGITEAKLRKILREEMKALK